MVDWVVGFVAERKEVVLPAILDSEIGIGRVEFEIYVMLMAIQDGQHHIVEFGVESC